MINSATFWDNVADKYAASPISDKDAYQYTLDRTRSYLRASDHVLELGSGTGSTALLLASSVDTYVATDISPKMLEIGQRNAQEQGIGNVEFVATDAGDAASEGAAYDAVLALNLLHLVPDLPAALANAHAMLKPGGHFISKTICLPEHGFPLKFHAMRTALPIMRLLGKAPPVFFYRIDELEEAVQKAGFEIIETGNHPAQPPSRYIVARKL